MSLHVQGLIRHFGETKKSYGVGALFHEATLLVINRLVRFEILEAMTAELKDIHDDRFFDAAGFEGRFVTSEELRGFVENFSEVFTSEFVERALARGDRCYGIFDGRELAAFGWYSERPTRLFSNFILGFAGGYTYVYNAYTRPAYRGKRLHAVGMCRALRELHSEGKRGLVALVDSKNFASSRSTTRMGFRNFGRVFLLYLGRYSKSFVTPGCRPYGFRVKTELGAER